MREILFKIRMFIAVFYILAQIVKKKIIEIELWVYFTYVFIN